MSNPKTTPQPLTKKDEPYQLAPSLVPVMKLMPGDRIRIGNVEVSRFTGGSYQVRQLDGNGEATGVGRAEALRLAKLWRGALS